jgi:Reverse transcriptase (RNA-dependent DNA polymerase)
MLTRTFIFLRSRATMNIPNVPLGPGAMPVPPVPVAAPFTIKDALVLCGVDDHTMFQYQTQATRIAEGIFSNSFADCMDKSMKDLKDDFESFATLNVNQGQIRLNPAVKKRIRALIQWARDMIRKGLDPSLIPFPVHSSATLERRLVTHELYVKNAKDTVDTLKPKALKGEIKWMDWKPTLINFLYQLPGRDGVPLSYVVREKENPDYSPCPNFLDEYVACAPLQGEAFEIDNARVANIIQSLIVGNVQAETKVQTIRSATNGRAMFRALDEYYLGVGVFAMEMTAAEKILETIYYNGERKPHMWWDEFERQITLAYATVDKTEGREVYSNAQKLRALVGKQLRADFLAPQLASINTELTRDPMTYTFADAMKAVRNVVNQKHPPTMNSNYTTAGTSTRTTRHVRESSSHRPRAHGGRGHGGRGTNQRTNQSGRASAPRTGRTHSFSRKSDVTKTRNDSEIVRLNNNKWVEYHPSFLFSSDLYQEFPADLKDKMKRQRDEHRRSRNGSSGQSVTSVSQTDTLRQIQTLQAQLDTMRGSLTAPPVEIAVDSQSRVSQVSFPSTTIMGGRNDQATRHQSSRNDQHNPRQINQLSIQRLAQSTTTAPPTPSAPAYTTADNETDSNADTTVLGRNFVLLELTPKVAEVYAYDPSIPPITVPIGTGATAFDHPDGYTILLIIHEALWYGSRLDHSLINPNQVRAYGIPYWDNPFDPDHPLGLHLAHDTFIPFVTRGTKVLFTSRVPTQHELQDPNIPRFELTSPLDWDPTFVSLAQTTTASRMHGDPPQHWINPMPTDTHTYYDPSSDEALLHSTDPTLFHISRGRVNVSQIDHYDLNFQDKPLRRTFVSTDRHQRATAETLSEFFGIGIDRARKTLSATLQKGTRSAILPLDIRRLNGKFATDTAYFPCRSLRGNVASQIYYDKCGFAACYHLPRADNVHVGATLPAFTADYGIPDNLTMDGAQVQIGRNTEFQKFIRRHDISFHVSHPRRPNENPAEGGIREIKRRFYRFVQKHSIPLRLWDFVLDYTIEIMNVSVNGSRYANSRTPLEIITGITPDISEYLDFHIYSWVYYKTNAGLGPRLLGRWLGVSHRRGPLMTYWILTSNGDIISCDSVQRVTNAEIETQEVRDATTSYTEQITPRLTAAAADVHLPDLNYPQVFDLEQEDEEFLRDFNRLVETTQIETDASNDILQPDGYLNMEIGIRRDSEMPLERAIVKRRKVDDEGNPVGSTHPSGNPLLDQRMYEVEFLDGTQQTLAANFLAENILAQVDDDGHRHLFLDEIIDHRRHDNAVPIGENLLVTRSGATRKIQTTRGWDIFVQWKDGSTSWIPLKEMKESFPVETARYGRDRKLLDEPAFDWWARHVLKKAQTVLSKVKSKYWERTHKYGIRIPKTVKEAIMLDKENGDTLWMDSIRKEMSAMRVALEEFEGDVKDLIGYQLITGHLVFDVKLGENFRRKARYCADGHKTQAPSAITYSSVVSRDSVRIMLLIAALNNLSLKAADIQNAFLTAPNLEKVYIIAGPEFGPDEGKTFIVRRALYGLKSASAAFRTYLAEKLEEIGFRSSIADPDVWMRPATGPDGTQYYSYVLAYVDDILAIDLDPDGIMSQIGERFRFKNDEVKEPESYLGAKLQQRTLDGVAMWTMSSVMYTDAALKNIADQLKNTEWTLPHGATTPMQTDYHPELDDTPLLDDENKTRFQELIGIIRWATEIGRVDVLHEVSILSQYQAQPREGHLRQLIRIFSYWKSSPKMSLYFDPRLPNIDYTTFTTNPTDFYPQYRGAKEESPHNMPPPRGQPVTITAFVDASHAANQKTRRSHTGYLIFLNRAPILWYSKRQNTVEASTFSSEFIALKACTEAIIHLRYKLRMFGIPLCREPPSEQHPDGIDLPAYVFCDNQSVVKNSTHIESTLNKKHSSLAYHFIRWNVAAHVISISWISTHDNLADTFTKVLPKATRDFLYGNWTY